MVTPAAGHLFDVNEMELRLEEAEGRDFHRATAGILLMCKRPIPGIQTSVALLNTRVKDPTYEYWKKLVRVLAYLKGTPEDFFDAVNGGHQTDKVVGGGFVRRAWLHEVLFTEITTTLSSR